jgi:phosphomannomutase / phosphoglucomutase
MSRWQISSQVPFNSFDYFEKTLITPNGFREYDVRWLLGKEINPNGFVVLGKAYGTYIQSITGQNTVVIGHDFRLYSQDLERSFVVGLLSTGAHVIDIGLCISPMVYFAQYHFNSKGGVMITASHNENGWTGAKLADGLSSTLGPAGITAFRAVVESGQFTQAAGAYESFDGIFDPYLADVLVPGRLKRRIKVVAAAGNGTAGRFVPTILREAGCDVVEVDCTADWDFKRHNPNPENVKFLHSMQQAVQESGAALGIGIDGDGDRIGIIDDQGREIFSDKMGLLLARWICPRFPGRSLVVDVKSTGLFFRDPVLEAARANVILEKTGHSYIKARVAASNAIAGFEKSGHWFFNEPLGRRYDDAVVSALHVLRLLDETGQPLSGLIDALPKTWSSPTMGAFCTDDVKYKVVDAVTELYRNDQKAGIEIAGQRIHDIVTVNGVRFVLEDGSWGLVRASSNQPSLVVVAESASSEDQLYDIVGQIQQRLAGTGKVGAYDQQLPARSPKQ